MSPYSQDNDPRMAGQHGGRPRQGCALPPRLMMMLVMAAIAVGSYMMKTKKEVNDVTGRVQRVALSPDEERALGLNAAPEMIRQHGGEVTDPRIAGLVDQIGARLVQANAKGEWADNFAPYQFDFHVLNDSQTINAFALPGGQIFFTVGLLKHLKGPDGGLDPNQIAGVLGHEIGHVIGRHSSEQMAKDQLIGGLVQAGAIGMSDGGAGSAQMAQFVGQFMQTKYGRHHENESDELGVVFMTQAGFKPEGLIQVMEVLEREAGGSRQPEFLSTHPNPGNRREHIKQVIEQVRSGTWRKGAMGQ